MVKTNQKSSIGVTQKLDRRVKQISEAALVTLVNYDWLGNVRELKNIIERLAILTPAEQILLEDIPLLPTKGN